MKVRTSNWLFGIMMIVVIGISFMAASCNIQQREPESSTGVVKATATIQTDANGFTAEQRNIMEKYKRDNVPGAIKHLYIISAYSGQVLIYSTVQGKVTSGNKRLTPSTVTGSRDWGTSFSVKIGANTYYTNEVLGDDGAYGGSGEYIFWFDTKGIMHQQYMGGGMILHISDQPLAVKSVTINMELENK
jgi:hypothetical protein